MATNVNAGKATSIASLLVPVSPFTLSVSHKFANEVLNIWYNQKSIGSDNQKLYLM
jgi:hypothetical protein